MPAFPERLDNETDKAYRALCDYAAMGAGRSLETLCKRYRIGTESVPARRLTTIKEWNRLYDWQARIRRYDAAAAAERAADLREAHRGEVEALRQQAREDAKTLRALGRGLAGKLARRLQTLSEDGIEPGQLASLATAVSKALVGALDLDAAALGVDAVLEHLGSDDRDTDTTEQDPLARTVAR